MPSVPSELLRKVDDLQSQGHMEDAERVLRDALSAHARAADAMHRLAGMVFQRGAYSEAKALLERAMAQEPNVARYCLSLGQVHRAMTNLPDAEHWLQRALELDSTLADAWTLLGLVKKQQGQRSEAQACYERALQVDAQAAEAWLNQGNLDFEDGHLERAAARYSKAAEANPQMMPAHYHLGLVCARLSRHEQAVAHFLRALEIVPAATDCAHALAVTLCRLGRLPESERWYRQAADTQQPGFELLVGLALVLQQQQKYKDAIEIYGAAFAALKAGGGPAQSQAAAPIPIDPEGHSQDEEGDLAAGNPVADALNNVGVCLFHVGRLEEATNCFEGAIKLAPEFVSAIRNMAVVHSRVGRLQESSRFLDRALAIRPSYAWAHSGKLMNLNYLDTVGPTELLNEHLEFGRRHSTRALEGDRPRATGSRREEGRIRIGYVSPDFRRHSVAYFMEPILRHHDRRQFEIVCYYLHGDSDEVTHRLRAHSDAWHQLPGYASRRLAQRIQQDGVDLLFDLAGHTSASPTAFCFRPAARQATYLGYPTTTGLPAIDFRISDWLVDPPGFESRNAESVIRLPGSYFCYQPPLDEGVGPEREAVDLDTVRFGCFNNLRKISPTTLRLWAAILHAVPGARLLIKGFGVRDEGTRSGLLQTLSAAGIGSERIDLMHWSATTSSHLATYRTVDIALDTYPYNGATTTCEALFMGVPVITLAGETHASRMGMSILNAVGRAEWIAEGEERYVELALELAARAGELRKSRSALRELVLGARLTDAARFTREFESCLLQICSAA